MSNKQIVFTDVNEAKLLQVDYVQPGPKDVVVKTAFSTISCGTERAKITGDPNVNASTEASDVPPFPRTSGYNSAGVVVEVGSDVTSVKPGDRVVVFWGHHKIYNTVPEENVVRIEDDRISLQEAAISFIATFSMAGMRKTRLEIGESVLIMGQGLLGQIAVQLTKAAGAVPVIAVDPIAERRETALKLGADYALDPTEADFADRVKELTGGGANVAIEVTGLGIGLNQALDCMAKFGRVSLLGCTRNPNFTVDYYRKIHFPGITLVGAHTKARPEHESHPGFFTHRDDIKAILRLCAAGRIDLRGMIAETHAPEDCQAVYTRLITDRAFPTVVQFDWTAL